MTTTPYLQTRDRALSLALRLRKAGCHDEAQRLRIAVQQAERQDQMQRLGRQVTSRTDTSAEAAALRTTAKQSSQTI